MFIVNHPKHNPSSGGATYERLYVGRFGIEYYRHTAPPALGLRDDLIMLEFNLDTLQLIAQSDISY
jgi:hypothetical protein